jgi:hypothetical protein
MAEDNPLNQMMNTAKDIMKSGSDTANEIIKSGSDVAKEATKKAKDLIPVLKLRRKPLRKSKR